MAASEATLRQRQAAARARQPALWSRARSLCRRLRALQARQVERHVRQQLGGVGRSRAQPGRGEFRRLADGAAARLRAAQRGCDSDATESASEASSSSDSCSSAGSSLGNSSSESSASSDSEGPETGPGHRRSTGVGRRLSQRQWAVERAAIICRWTWLQAQVLDLEYRIRQQTDIYRQLRSSKGPVILGNLEQDDGLKPASWLASPTAVMNSQKNPALLSSSSSSSFSSSHLKTPCIPSYLLQNAEKQNSHLAQSLRNLVCQNPSCAPINGSPESPKTCASPHQVNGISNCLSACTPGSGSPKDLAAEWHPKKPTVGLDSSCMAARIRPICRYKKRQLVRINAATQLNRKPPKPLSLRCTCEQPNSCILCDFKASLQSIDPETMSLEERIALLDSGFHPILSFPHGALLKGLAGCSLCGPCAPPNKPGASHQVPSLCLENPPVLHASHFPGHPTMAGSSALFAKKKKLESSYDINNIVIPMSMASATRVEKLQYKEILTPSWRTVDPKELVISEGADTELEDTSDEIYLNYHQKFEELERARWNSWTGTSSQRRGNRSSQKVDGHWGPHPSNQDSRLNSLHYPQGANFPTVSLSTDPSTVPTSLWFRGQGGNSFSEDSSFITAEIQNMSPWEPRAFPLSNADYQALQPPSHKTFGQPWDARSNQALRTNHINATGLFHPREVLPAKRQAPPRDNNQQGPAEPHCYGVPMLNNR